MKLENLSPLHFIPLIFLISVFLFLTSLLLLRTSRFPFREIGLHEGDRSRDFVSSDTARRL